MTVTEEPVALALRLPRSRAGREPQNLLITVLGDYWHDRWELLPAGTLVAVLAEFGVSAPSTRQAMRRLLARDLLVHERVGRTAFYGSRRQSPEVTAARLHRAMGFGASYPEWDGKWTAVSFSVPEKDRDVRRRLRKGLRSHKFGLLNDAIWVTPHRRVTEAEELLDSLGVADASIIRAERLIHRSSSTSFSDVFELDALATGYLAFVERYGPMVEWARSGRMTPAEALVSRTTLMNDWLSFRVRDPELPGELLPDDWPRPRAREIFVAIYDGLGAIAEIRFRQLVAGLAPELASLASHHTAGGVA